ncbi:leader peptidase (prepilin peptidase)/N-methyltransferase [Geomicrobium halophilum]|uniref:Leader peptidase (Prepilin peptidase)/N-methyltransferase n=1 Tax=Geomicrobium halophilum TaxID=549000 RepID=A0A841PKX5_9BACL|nr:A24 family peptidase [Geomicrobium halophilum]MBB6448344.1 leader peptidase (prepilin peptidase)/N-methyltransferase [Geomicrobium halophilum]
MLFELSFFLLLGLTFGSFFQVIGVRVPLGEPIAWSRSVCPRCKKILRARDLFPVLSYLITFGKCRYCAVRISPGYPLAEIVTASLFVLIYVRYQVSPETIMAIIVISLVIIVTITDLHYMRIPNSILAFFACLLIFVRIFLHPFDPWWDPFMAALLSFSVLFVLMNMSGGGLGGGDVKLFAVLGLAFGLLDLLLVFFLSTLVGTAIGIGSRILARLKPGQPFPFAPSIALAVIIVVMAGDWLWHWYSII